MNEARGFVFGMGKIGIHSRWSWWIRFVATSDAASEECFVLLRRSLLANNPC